ncbi:hypothetical protein, partial [Nosocomiicoccus ampullae]|uniref:hypothetical protein n=1 Tax=Nosocomiicoccus ampullae TaxID=489910 RepID=UPI00254C5C40
KIVISVNFTKLYCTLSYSLLLDVGMGKISAKRDVWWMFAFNFKQHTGQVMPIRAPGQAKD